jgi:GDPmannose 4,6-dehydratase
MTVNYREGYKMFACNGILFNHESPRRGETFVTRKITRALANMLAGKQRKLYLGNIESKRDWGFAPEYVECQWLILQQNKPEDFVIGTGESHSVREFLEAAFNYVGIEIGWKGKGVKQKGIIRSINSKQYEVSSKQQKAERGGALVHTPYSLLKTGNTIIEIDPKYFRPTEVDYLKADITKARQKLGWEPRTTFSELVKIMVDYDMKLIKLTPVGEGIKICEKKGFTYTRHDFSKYEKIRERC